MVRNLSKKDPLLYLFGGKALKLLIFNRILSGEARSHRNDPAASPQAQADWVLRAEHPLQSGLDATLIKINYSLASDK